MTDEHDATQEWDDLTSAMQRELYEGALVDIARLTAQLEKVQKKLRQEIEDNDTRDENRAADLVLHRAALYECDAEIAHGPGSGLQIADSITDVE